MVEISQNTENSPVDLRGLADIKNLVKDYQLTLMSEICKRKLIIIIKIIIIYKKKDWKIYNSWGFWVKNALHNPSPDDQT